MVSPFDQNGTNRALSKRIVFSNQFYGRDQELEILHHMFDGLCHQVRPTHIIKDQGVAVGSHDEATRRHS
jgi:hypothetical protein